MTRFFAQGLMVLLTGIMVCPASLMAASGDTVDQSQEQRTAYSAIPIHSKMGQSFVPQLSKLDFVELLMNDNTTATTDGRAYMMIREDSLDGPTIGASEVVFLENTFNFPDGTDSRTGGGPLVEVRFDFTDTVDLIPGDLYVIEVVALSSSFGVGHADQNVYPSGMMYMNGVPEPGRDMWFREGMVPEPVTMSLLAIGGLAMLRRRRK